MLSNQGVIALQKNINKFLDLGLPSGTPQSDWVYLLRGKPKRNILRDRDISQKNTLRHVGHCRLPAFFH